MSDFCNRYSLINYTFFCYLHPRKQKKYEVSIDNSPAHSL